MIISDEDDSQKIKDPPVAIPTLRHPEPAATRPFTSLPDYETSQALAFRDFNDSQVTLYKPPPRRRILDSRVWRAVITSLVVYILLTLVIAVPIIVHKYEEEQKYPPYTPLTYALTWLNKTTGGGSPHLGSVNFSSPTPQGIFPVCNAWATVEYREDSNGSVVLAATETLVSPTGRFSLSSNASYDNDFNLFWGSFYAGINPNESVQDAVLSIVMQTSSPSVFDQTYTCTAIADNFTDLSLYAPDNLNPTDNIQYNITLLFPRTECPSRIQSLTTFLPMFDQRFNSGDNISFETVSIQGPISQVTADLIQADRLSVDTSLEPVTGTFRAQSSLFISTIMAPINVNISLINDPRSLFPTVVDVHTGNSNLTANVTVLAPHVNPPARPNFIANFRTFSGDLFTSLLHDPASPPAVINLQAVNDLGTANVILDSLFEGMFHVFTKQAYPSVTQGNASAPYPGDPQLVRTIVVDYNSTTQSMGWIGWENTDSGPPWNSYQQGEVVVSSSLGNVSLSFLG